MKVPPPPSPQPSDLINVTCDWSPWLNADSPDAGQGDMETVATLQGKYGICSKISDIQCRVAGSPTLFSQSGQTHLTCDVLNGLRCFNDLQNDGQCLDYEVRVLCWNAQCKGMYDAMLYVE